LLGLEQLGNLLNREYSHGPLVRALYDICSGRCNCQTIIPLEPRCHDRLAHRSASYFNPKYLPKPVPLKCDIP
jgi:hypothetical protein